MASEQKLNIFFLPFMAPGHMIPAMNMARLFTTRGIKSTIVTTPTNNAFFAETIEIDNQKPGIEINLLTMKFPSEEAGLPEGSENANSTPSTETLPKFLKAVDLLRHPFEKLIEKYRPNCIVADFFFTWANSTAKNFGIPCLAFHGTSYFSQCIISNLLSYEPHKKLSSDSEIFIVPGDLPHEIKLAKSELSPSLKKEGPKFLIEFLDKTSKAMRASYGVIMNSFYELEPAYADYYENVLGMKHWHIGPLSLYFSEEEIGGNHRGKKSSIDVKQCMRWLDEKDPHSVLYVCFGSMSRVQDAQLHEIAIALEALGQNFILVVGEDTKDWVTDGFGSRVKEQGLIIRGWAPQARILNHQGVGGFVTHCGWNSILEGVIAGVPMVTWPQHAEQFFNEKLVTDVLKIGSQVGAKIYPSTGNENILIGNEEILRAMKRVMVDEEAQDMRKRAKEFKEMARRAISEGGSSFKGLNALIAELKSFKK